MVAPAERARARQAAVGAGKWLGARAALLLYRLLGPRAHGSFGILLYHRVADPCPGLPSPTLNVSPAAFRRQVEGLLAAGWEVLALPDVLRRAATGVALPPRAAVLTFDDGYGNVHANALPVLAEFGAPASVFLTTAYVGSREPFPFDEWGCQHRQAADRAAWQPVTWGQCTELAGSGLVDLGSHTHTHRNFRGRPDEFARDLRASLEVLGGRLGEGARTFSYPSGSVSDGFADESLQRAARSVGVRCGLTTEIGLVRPDADRFTWGRIEVVDADDAATLEAKLSGWYSWMNAARGAFRRVLR
jgi:peptidoglycan/xylan/chitin deacetylase (PgdA/CDA1 family)